MRSICKAQTKVSYCRSAHEFHVLTYMTHRVAIKKPVIQQLCQLCAYLFTTKRNLAEHFKSTHCSTSSPTSSFPSTPAAYCLTSFLPSISISCRLSNDTCCLRTVLQKEKPKLHRFPGKINKAQNEKQVHLIYQWRAVNSFKSLILIQDRYWSHHLPNPRNKY